MLNEFETSTLVLGWALVGLLVGSFLNVVIHRLPRMLEAQWASELEACVSTTPPIIATDGATSALIKKQSKLSLSTPKSRCPKCDHSLRWFENIPLLSYAALRGKCSACGISIGKRYPLIELLTAVFFGYCCNRWGPSQETIVWSAFSALLLCLATIDWDTTILPDDLNYILIWLGLISSTVEITGISATQSIQGAVFGYLSLWSIYWIFKLITGKEGMGHGDFKLLAGLGAWFGATSLIPLMIYASISGLAVGLLLKSTDTLRDGKYIPFGPFLATAGYLIILFNPQKLALDL
jgi:leader peptidase (prepilin peptidase) / N-methyltransferase